MHPFLRLLPILVICSLYVRLNLTMKLIEKKLPLEKSALIHPFEIHLNLSNERNKLNYIMVFKLKYTY